MARSLYISTGLGKKYDEYLHTSEVFGDLLLDISHIQFFIVSKIDCHWLDFASDTRIHRALSILLVDLQHVFCNGLICRFLFDLGKSL